MENIIRSDTNLTCPNCVYNHKKCSSNCRDAKNFRDVISREDYRTIFNIFRPKNLASILESVPEHRYTETLHSFLFEARARIVDPVGGWSARMASLERKVEKLHSRSDGIRGSTRWRVF